MRVVAWMTCNDLEKVTIETDSATRLRKMRPHPASAVGIAVDLKCRNAVVARE